MMAAPLSIAVLVSAGRHPVTGAPRACRGDAIAMAFARTLAASPVRVVHAGQAQEPALQDYLAYGAGGIEVLDGATGAAIVPALASALKDADLVVTGCRAESGAGSGLLPYALAEAMQRPMAASVLEARIGGRDIDAVQFLPKGKRRRLSLSLPAVIAVHPLAAAPLTYAHARRVNGAIITHPLASMEPAPSHEMQFWTVTPSGRPLVRLKAEEKRSAQDRLNAAIATEAKRGVVVNEGSDVDKAQVVLDYLRQHHLIEF